MSDKTLSPRLPPMTDLPPTANLEGSEEFVNQTLEDFVKARGGLRVIKRILIANNGIAAVKAIRSMRKWAYETFGKDNVLEFVVMATPEDIKANAAYIHLADEFIQVPGGTNNNNYANVKLIVDIAERCGAHAVWPGWGHASENPALPQALKRTKTNIAWIGPPPEAMIALGDKIGSTLIAQSTGVACLPWSGSGLTVNYAKEGMPADIYSKACAHSVKEAVQMAEEIGYPIMIKASEGGGGKGIRKVTRAEDVELAFSQCQSEVPGSPIFLMKMANNCRHLEVQLLADEHGEAIAVYGRDCSIQRRNQKIIEEGPVVGAPPHVWRQMELAAISLAKEVGYHGVGTVEWIYMPDGTYSFLELNPRLQVEHPVTELISGVNLPAAQLQVAMGIPLRNISHIRKMYNQKPGEMTEIDFSKPGKILPGHVIACRITAENPDKGFQPTSGEIKELNFRSTPNVWGYFSVSAGSNIHEFSDSQFGHLFALGNTRESARRNMATALKELTIRGDIRTTVEYLRKILEHPDFMKNDLTTSWLEKTMAAGYGLSITDKPPSSLTVLMAAAYKSFRFYEGKFFEFKSTMERGQMPSKQLHNQMVKYDFDLIYDDVKYTLKSTKSGANSVDLQLNGWTGTADVFPLADRGVLILCNGKKYVVYGQQFPSGLRLTIDGQTCVFSEEYDPTQLRSTMQGKLVRFLVDQNTHVDKGQAFAEMEVMKMFITVPAPEAGTVRLLMPEGSVVEAGALLANLDLDEPERIKRAEIFKSDWPAISSPVPIGDKANLRLENALRKLACVLRGYQLSPSRVNSAVGEMMESLRDPRLPLEQFEGAISSLTGRLPGNLFASLASIVEKYKAAISSNRFYWERTVQFPVLELEHAIDTCMLTLESQKQKEQLTGVLNATGIHSLLKNYKDGLHTNVVGVLSKLIQDFYDVEKIFLVEKPEEEQFKDLRSVYGSNHEKMIEASMAHSQLAPRSELVARLLSLIESELTPLLEHFLPTLQTLAEMSGRSLAHVVLMSRQLIMKHDLPSSAQRRIATETILSSAATAPTADARLQRLMPLIDQTQPIADVVFQFFRSNKHVGSTAMEVYIRRMYRGCTIHYLSFFNTLGADIACNFVFSSGEALDSDISKVPKMLSTKRGSLANFRVDSVSNISNMLNEEKDPSKKKSSSPTHRSSVANAAVSKRSGIIAYFKDFDSVKKSFEQLVTDGFKDNNVFAAGEPVNVVYNVVYWGKTPLPTDQMASEFLSTLIKSNRSVLDANRVRRITFVLTNDTEERPALFTFRNRLDFEEDLDMRHIEPSSATLMQLERLSNFNYSHQPSTDRSVHCFAAIPKDKGGAKVGTYDGRRFFTRVICRRLDSLEMRSSEKLSLDAHPEAEFAFVEALNSLQTAIAANSSSKWENNHIFLNILVEAALTTDYVEGVIRLLAKRYAEKIRRLNVSDVEFACVLNLGDGVPTCYRYTCTNPTGYRLQVDCYAEQLDDQDRVVFVLQTPSTSTKRHVGFSNHEPAWNGLPVHFPYSVTRPLQKQRETSVSVGTPYVYDFLVIFERCLFEQWRVHIKANPNTVIPDMLLDAVELVLAKDAYGNDCVEEVRRAPGLNKCGMVAWRLTLYTPQFPGGREVVLISNDISHQMGTFGPNEDTLFYYASAHARLRGIPRLNFHANSGARIGLAEELRYLFKVKWVDDKPEKGHEYLYFEQKDYEANKDFVIAHKVEGTTRYRVTDIIGKEHGLNVENLSGSGMIAGETSLAYEEIFTLTYITGRTVGIGSYLARLGQRVIQKCDADAPIILTGYNALNKLLGRQIYTSNLQLGGPDIMYTNGVTHAIVENDMKGVALCLQWLNFVPKHRSAPGILHVPTADSAERKVMWSPENGRPYDPRSLCRGEVSLDGNWVGGFFDRGSFVELLGGWARTVMVGRASLGGIPMGVIAVETRTVQQVIPADPAMPDSKETVLMRAGQVWYPDSAHKTAQGIKDMIAEDLPLIVFANWRGFSGGMRDMFDEVLKFGALIVDALRVFDQPVFVYIPPFGTLRGGAWVVVDPTINERHMEMFADPTARGGVLETEGTTSVKFAKPECLKAIHRLDATTIALDAELAMLKKTASAAAPGDKALMDDKKKSSKKGKEEEKALLRTEEEVLKDIAAREKALFPAFNSMAAAFADLHDTPGRMKAKKVISEVVPWADSRSFFFFRLRRRLVQNQWVRRIYNHLRVSNTSGVGGREGEKEREWKRAKSILNSWIEKDLSQFAASVQADDKLFVDWVEKHQDFLTSSLKALEATETSRRVRQLASSNAHGVVDGLAQIIMSLSAEERAALEQKIK